jgi:hypothetical protein
MAGRGDRLITAHVIDGERLMATRIHSYDSTAARVEFNQSENTKATLNCLLLPVRGDSTTRGYGKSDHALERPRSTVA